MAEATTLFDGSKSLCMMPQLTKVTFQPNITQDIDRDGLIMKTPCLEVGRTHLGSISNLVQASTEFSAFRTEDRARAWPLKEQIG